MKLSLSVFILMLFEMAMLSAYEVSDINLRGSDVDRDLYYYNATNSSYYNSTSNSTNLSFQDKTKEYVVNHASENYETTPSNWSTEQWSFFALAMFVFGCLSSLWCILVVVPCCCPMTMKTAYARLLNPNLEESKRVRLIKK